MLRAARLIVEQAGPTCRLRIGVNSWRGFADDFGPTFRRTYSVKGRRGEPRGARVMGRPHPGRCSPHPPCSPGRAPVSGLSRCHRSLVKGKTEPVVAAASGPRGPARGSRAASTALVGRETEMGVLLGALAEARLGRRTVLCGRRRRAGIGKSRARGRAAGARVRRADRLGRPARRTRRPRRPRRCARCCVPRSGSHATRRPRRPTRCWSRR